jgi:hypothetical protein
MTYCYLHKLYFSCKNSTYCAYNFDPDPEPHGYALKPMWIFDTALIFYLTCEGGGPREPLGKKADPFVSASTDRQLSGWNHC